MDSIHDQLMQAAADLRYETSHQAVSKARIISVERRIERIAEQIDSVSLTLSKKGRN